MKALSLKGCGTALVTPFDGQSVDYEAFAASVDRQVAAGIHFLVPLGTTGETPCLSEEERVRVLALTREHSNGLPVIVGGGTNSLVGTRKNIKLLEPYGADAFLIVTPYYNKPTQRGLYEYYQAVAESTDKPIVIYNVPSRTGVNITAETTLRLAEDMNNIVAVKEASSNYNQISEIIKYAPDGFSVLSGNDNETLSLMATGADGIVSVASNVDPVHMVMLTEAIMKGNLTEARRLHHLLMPLFRNCFIESNPLPAKAALAKLGLMKNELRLPLVPATEATEKIMEDTIKALGLL